MAKLESADAFIALVKSGKYESKINAKRGAGRTSLSESEKQKAFSFIEKYFPDEGASAKPSKKVGKKAGKKAAKRVVHAAPAAKVGRKKGTKRAATAEVPGTLPISPKEVDSVAEMLTLIDSTVAKGVSIIAALQRADELSKSGDITAGVAKVKAALEGAAHILHQSVVTPLAHTTPSPQPDLEVANRLNQVVAASNAVMAQTNSYNEPPQPPIEA